MKKIETPEMDTGQQVVVETEEPLEISSHAISRTMVPQAMRVGGAMGHHSIIILIDSDSNDRFIDHATTKRIRTTIQKRGILEVFDNPRILISSYLSSRFLCLLHLLLPSSFPVSFPPPGTLHASIGTKECSPPPLMTT